MIIVNKPLVLTQNQNIKFENLILDNSQKLSARVNFGVYNGENRVSSYTLTYTDKDYNDFWNNFNSGKFLFLELVKKQNLGVQVSDTIENDFLNK